MQWLFLLAFLSFSVQANLFDRFDLSTERIFRSFACEGKIDELKKLLNDGQHPNTLGALNCAVSYGQLEAVKLLLNKGADINYKKDDPNLKGENDNGLTPLQSFFSRSSDGNFNNERVLDYLIEKKAQVLKNDNYALSKAFVQNYPISTLKKLIKLEGGASAETFQLILKNDDYFYSWGPIRYRWVMNEKDLVKLIKIGLTKKIINQNVVCKFNQSDMFPHFFAAGLKPNTCPWLTARLVEKDPKAAKYLIKMGATFPIKFTERQVSFFELAFPDIEFMEFFRKQGIDINHTHHLAHFTPWNALATAIKASNHKVVQYLIDIGVNTSPGAKYTNLAVRNNDLNMVKLLLENGVKPHENSEEHGYNEYQASIDIAAFNFRHDMLDILHQYGARFHDKNFNSQAIFERLTQRVPYYYDLEQYGEELKKVEKLVDHIIKLGGNINFKHPTWGREALCKVDNSVLKQIYIKRGAVCTKKN